MERIGALSGRWPAAGKHCRRRVVSKVAQVTSTEVSNGFAPGPVAMASTAVGS
jgi:hypothetical protein